MSATKLQVSTEKEENALLHLEAAINLIPFAGGFLATYFGKLRARRVDERMEAYFRQVRERIAELDEKKLDKEYLNSEHFAELFAQGAEHAARSTTEERIRRFANVIVNNALSDPESRTRTQGIMTLVERLSDLDAFILLCFGPPELASMRAPTRAAAVQLVRDLAAFLGNEEPADEQIAESLIYMDNLGVTWVTQQALDNRATSERSPVAEFSVFRSPLGDTVVQAVAPPGFYMEAFPKWDEGKWPQDYVSNRYRQNEMKDTKQPRFSF